MYSEAKVAERLSQAAELHHFTPEYHSVSDVAQFELDLTSRNRYVLDASNRIVGTQNLSSDDVRFMLNEQILCACDSAYWMTRFAYCKSEKGIVDRFRFRVPQRIYFDIICDLQDRGAAIEVMILKARQLGMSLFTELLITHRVLFSYGVNAVVGSADQQKTGEMSEMMLLAYDALPYWLRPQSSARVAGARGKLIFNQLATGVSFQHGSQKFGIATGSTPTVYHLSEVALYADAVKLIDEGLWKAVHASPAVIGILESTGRSNEGWWADTWHYSKDNWPSCRMHPMFLPWFCGVDIYPMETDRLTHPIPPNWLPRRPTFEHAAKAALYVQSYPLLERHLTAEQIRRGARTPDDRRPWTMPLDQQWYWEWNHEEAEYKDTESSFLQEMASDDEEALQRSTESVFGHHTITEIDNSRQRDFSTFTITGESIEESHLVDPIYYDYSCDRLPVSYPGPKGTARWELIPLKPVDMRDDHPEDADEVLCIWEHPQPGVHYAIGGDTSSGTGEDSTCAEVWRLAFDDQPDVQVAEFASTRVSHVESWAFFLAIAAYYGRHMREGRENGILKWKEPYVSIEQVAAVGDTAQHQMGLWGYTNFHHMSRIDMPTAKIRKHKRGPGTKLGWFTYGWSRPLLIGDFVQGSKNGWRKVNSPWLLHEMKHFEVHQTAGGKERMEHEDGEHDDRIFASAMATYPPKDMEQLAKQSKKRSSDPLTLPHLDLDPVSGGLTITPRQMTETTPLSLDDVLHYAVRGR